MCVVCVSHVLVIEELSFSVPLYWFLLVWIHEGLIRGRGDEAAIRGRERERPMHRHASPLADEQSH